MEKDEKGFFIVVATVLFLLLMIFLVLTLTNAEETIECKSCYYINVTASEAESVIENHSDMLVVDVRGLEGCGLCDYKKGHLPGAVRYENPEVLYNSTEDILVYSQNGTIGAIFCLALVNNVQGYIYNLEGGWEAWIS